MYSYALKHTTATKSISPPPGSMSSTTTAAQPQKRHRHKHEHRHFPDSHYDNAVHYSSALGRWVHPTTHYYQYQPATRGAKPTPTTAPDHARGETTAGGGEKRGKPERQNVYRVWRSRDNRKGRHAAVVFQPKHEPQQSSPSPMNDGSEKGRRGKTASRGFVTKQRQSTNSSRAVLRGAAKMLVRFPVWDVSYLVAIVFTLGSVVWCINGCFAWLPLAAPHTEFGGEADVAGILAFVGATIFEVGSVLMLLEAVNENRSDCFGWALEEAVEEHGHHAQSCQHHHSDKTSLLPSRDNSVPGRKWSWWPSAHELRTHYIRELGFLAALFQFAGATIFWMAGFTSLPPIYDSLSVGVANGTFWLPQVVGGCGFIVSSLCIMLEVQTKWWLLSMRSLGWHVGFWNLVGAVGFTLCGALGFGVEGSEGEAVEYASALSTFVGSWAFLIGSVIQWYESLNKYSLSVQRKPSWVSSSGAV